MTASLPLKALGLLTALAIVALAFLQASSSPPPDSYGAAVKLMAGVIMVIGSLFLSRSISYTFLRNGGRNAFKALYWAALSSAGAGVSEAASGLATVSVLIGLSLGALALASAGAMMIHYSGGGT
jgi:hypothetical protein